MHALHSAPESASDTIVNDDARPAPAVHFIAQGAIGAHAPPVFAANTAGSRRTGTSSRW
jgi:hypothetical protein